MKKSIFIVLSFILLFSLFSSVISAEESDNIVKVYFNNEKMDFDNDPYIETGTTMVPFRPIFEALGLNIGWNQETQTVTGNNGNSKIELVIDDNNAKVNGEINELQIAPTLVEGTTFIPLRFVIEASGAEVVWNQSTKTVSITMYSQEDLDKELIHTVVYSTNDKKVRELINKGANPNTMYNRNYPLLFEPVAYGRNKIVTELLVGGANVNVKNSKGNTPLMIAALTGNDDIINDLLKYGADPNIKNEEGLKALDYAKDNNNIDVINLLQEITVDNDKKEEMKTSEDIITKEKLPLILSFDDNMSIEVTDYRVETKGIYIDLLFQNHSEEGLYFNPWRFKLRDSNNQNIEYVESEGADGDFNFVGGKIFGEGRAKGTLVFEPLDEQSDFIILEGGLTLYKAETIKEDVELYFDSTNVITSDESTSEPNKTTRLEMLDFLEQNYSELETSIGETTFTFDIIENDTILNPYDFWIRVEYEYGFFNNVQYSNKISSEVRNKVKQELKEHQENLAKSLIRKFPNKKLYGGYFDSWYRYPTLKVDLQIRKYFSWTNYDGGILGDYESVEPSTFRWFDLIDDEL